MNRLEDWIDLLENELPEVVAVELELLLRHSVNDRRAFLNMAHLRDIVKSSDPVYKHLEKLESPQYQAALTGKIMAKVKKSKPKKKRPSSVSKKDNLLKLEMGSVS